MSDKSLKRPEQDEKTEEKEREKAFAQEPRGEPLCPFFGKCGGCAFQEMPFDAYLSMKVQNVERLLRQAGIEKKADKVLSVPLRSRRRATFAFFKSHLGFNKAKSHEIEDIASCLLLRPELERLIVPLRKLLSPLYSAGDAYVLALEEGADVRIEESVKKKTKLTYAMMEDMAAFARENDLARLTFNGDLIFQRTQSPLTAGDFLQPSKEGEAFLVEEVLNATAGFQKAADLFCGAGTFTVPLFKAGMTVLGVDSNKKALSVLQAAGIPFLYRDLFRFPMSAQEMEAFDVCVLDPPRAGALEQSRCLSQSGVKKIVMVSCAPNTFARDAAVLKEGGYMIKKLTVLDQFTFSRHIEAIGVFER